jgi:hypothetical protein
MVYFAKQLELQDQTIDIQTQELILNAYKLAINERRKVFQKLTSNMS